MSLHWFCPENGLTLIRQGRIALSSLTELHDPLLTQGEHVKPIDPGAPVTDSEMEAELQRQYSALPDHLKAMVKLDYFKQQALVKREEIEEQIRQRRNPAIAMLSAGQSDAVALLQLYASPTSLLLWEQKANQHRGMMFSFKNQIPDFMASKFQDKPQAFGKVIYSDQRPTKEAGSPMKALFTRPTCFSHEKESRLVRLKSTAEKHLFLNNKNWYLYKIPLAQLESVTFGCQMPAAEKDKIISIMRTDLRYRHIPLFQCRLDPLRFVLDIESLDE